MTTTINADGTITTGQNQGSNTNSSNPSNPSTGSETGVLKTYNDFIEPVGVDEERGAERSAIQDTSDFGAAVALEGHAAELSVGY